MTFRKCGVMAVLLCAAATGCWQVKAPAPAVPQGGPLPPGAVLRLGDARLAPHCRPWLNITYSPDGKRLASFASHNVLDIWDVATGKLVHRFTGFIGRLAWSPDGKTLANCNVVCSFISIVDAETGKELHRFEGDPDHVDLYSARLAFSHDSKIIAWYSRGTIHLYDLTRQQEIRQWPTADTYRVNYLAFAPDGKTLIACTGGEVALYDWTTEKEVFRVDGNHLSAVAISPDSKVLAVNDASGVSLFDLNRGKDAVATTMESPLVSITDLCFSPDGKTLASAGSDGQCVVWDLETKKVNRQFRCTTFEVFSYRLRTRAFAPDGQTLAWTCDLDDRIHVTDVATGQELHPADDKPLAQPLAFTPDARHLAAPCFDGKLRLWNAATGKLVRVFDEDATALQFLAFSGDGKKLVGIGKGTTVWDVETGQVTRHIENEVEPEWVIPALSADGKVLAIGDRMSDFLAKIYWVDLETGKVISRSTETTTCASCLAFAPDGKTMAYLEGLCCDIIRWDVATGKPLATVKCPTEFTPKAFQPHDWIETVAYSTDGKVLLASQGKRIVVLAPESGQELYSFAIPKGWEFLAFSPEGQFIVWTNDCWSEEAKTISSSPTSAARTRSPN